MRKISKQKVFDDYESLYLWWDSEPTAHEWLNCNETRWAICKQCGEMWDGLGELPSSFCWTCKSNDILIVREWLPIPFEPIFQRPEAIIVRMRFLKRDIKSALGIDQSYAIGNNLRFQIQEALRSHFRNEFFEYHSDILTVIRHMIDTGEIQLNPRRERYTRKLKCRCKGCNTTLRQLKYRGYCYKCHKGGHDLCENDIQRQLHTDK